jgi:hypothetical protein
MVVPVALQITQPCGSSICEGDGRCSRNLDRSRALVQPNTSQAIQW